jgi:hypothetical protein
MLLTRCSSRDVPRIGASAEGTGVYTRILTVNERQRVQNYLSAGTRSGPIRQLVARAKRYLPSIESDLELIKALLESDANRIIQVKPKMDLVSARIAPGIETYETAGVFVENCSVCGGGILDEENYCASCGSMRGSILTRLQEIRMIQL